MICRTLGILPAHIGRIYQSCGIRLFVDARPQWVDDGTWELFLPVQQRPDSELKRLKSTKGKFVEIIPGYTALTDRSYIWNQLLREQGREKACAIMPETFILGDAADRAALASLPETERLIVKAAAHRRKGVRLVDSPAEAIRLKNKYAVAQRLITDQLRFRDTTLHLRCYLLLTCKDSVLNAWFYEDAICGWAIPDATAKNEFDRLITHPDNPVPGDYPCSLEELSRALDFSFEKTWWDIVARVVGSVASCASTMCRLENLREATCFQTLGVDVILRSDLSPLICEFQVAPEMVAHTERYAAIKNKVIRDALIAAGVLPDEEHGFVKVMEAALTAS